MTGKAREVRVLRFVLSRARRAGALAVLSIVCMSAAGQTTAPGADGAAPGSAAPFARAADIGAAEVVVQNRLIAVMRGDLLGYSPTERANGATQRVLAILEKDGPGKLSIREVPEGLGFTVDGEFAFFLTPRDAHLFAGESLESIASQARESLETLLRERAERRDPQAIAIAASLASVATLIYVGLLGLIVVANRRVRQRVTSAIAPRARGMRIAGVSALELRHFLRGVRALVTGLSWVLGALITYVWIVYVFERFPYTRSWGERLLDELLASAEHFLRVIIDAVPGLFTVVVIYFLARWITQLSGSFFSRVEAGHVSVGWLDADTASPTKRIVSVVVWLFALAMAYPYLPGAQTDAFKGLSVLVGLMISIGASNLVGQAASGMILMYARSYRAGEFVRIGDTEGAVAELGLFSTRVRTGIGEEVMLPNSLVLSQTSKNYSRAAPGPAFLVDTSVSIAYSTPWRQVRAMLREAASRTPGVLSEPAPKVLQTALSDFYVEYRMSCLAGAESPGLRAEVLDQLHANIQDVFNEHGVQIMSPHYMTDPPEAQVVPQAKWYAAPAEPPAGEGKTG